MGCVLCMSQLAYLGETVSTAYDSGLAGQARTLLQSLSSARAFAGWGLSVLGGLHVCEGEVKTKRKQMLPSMSAQTAHEGIRRSAGPEALALAWGSGLAGTTKVRAGCMHRRVARTGAEHGKLRSSPSGRAELPWQAGMADYTVGGQAT